MFHRRVKYLQGICVAVLIAVIVVFAVVILSTRGQSQKLNAGSDDKLTASAYTADDYSTATQEEFEAILSESNRGSSLCPHHGQSVYPYLIRSPRQLAALFRYGKNSNAARTACFRVVFEEFPALTDLRSWTEDGKTPYPQVSFVCDEAGESFGLGFSGHIDFSGITLAMNTETEDYMHSGLFHDAKEARIENLNVALYGYGLVIGGSAINCTIRNINVVHHIASNVANLNYSQNRTGNKFYSVSTLLITNGSAAKDSGMDPSKCIIEDCNIQYVFDNPGYGNRSVFWDVYQWGGIAYTNFGIIRGCTVNYGDGDMSFTGLGGIVTYGQSTSKIIDCNVIFPSAGKKTFSTNKGSWGKYSVGGIAAFSSYFADTTFPNTGMEIIGCKVEINTDTQHSLIGNSGGIGGIVGMVNAVNGTDANAAPTKIKGCSVTGGELSANDYSVGGIAGKVATSLDITDCSVYFSGKMEAYAALGGIVGGDENYDKYTVKTVNLRNCEVAAPIMKSSESGLYCVGGIASLFRYNTNLNMDRCSVYAEAIQADGWAGGLCSYLSNNATVVATVTDCISYVKSIEQIPSRTNAINPLYSGDLWGQKQYGTLKIDGVTYLSSLGRIYGTRYTASANDEYKNLTAISTGTESAELTAALKTLDEKLGYAKKQTTGGSVTCSAEATDRNITVTISFDAADYKNCLLDALYISVIGDGAMNYTQLIRGGKVTGYLGAGAPAIGSSVLCPSFTGFTYATADITDLSMIRVRMGVETTIGYRVLLFDGNGNLLS